MLKCRFYVGIEKTGNDYRPVVWPIKYPYWCTGENDTDFILVAYVDSTEDLMKQWPEAHDIESEEVDKVEFSSRFRKPDWYKEDEDFVESTKELIKNCNSFLDELREMESGVKFLQNEYATNKRYFRDNPGRTTVNDVIKRTFEFAWAASNNFRHKQN